MRTAPTPFALLSVVSVVSLCAVAGCGDDTTGNGNTKVDMTVEQVAMDMATPPADQSGLDLTMQASGDMAQTTMTVQATVGANGALAFSPDPINIHAGDTVTWTFSTGGHNVVSVTNGAPDSKFCSPMDMNCNAAPTMAAGMTYSHTFMTPGKFPYACIPHMAAGMKGTVNVTMSQ